MFRNATSTTGNLAPISESTGRTPFGFRRSPRHNDPTPRRGDKTLRSAYISSCMNQQLPVIDPFGRAITYLRVSVTDRCDFRCIYCMSENMTFLPKAEILTLEELDRL